MVSLKGMAMRLLLSRPKGSSPTATASKENPLEGPSSTEKQFPTQLTVARYSDKYGWSSPVINFKEIQVVRKYLTGQLITPVHKRVESDEPFVNQPKLSGGAEATFLYGVPPDRNSCFDVVQFHHRDTIVPAFVPIALREAFVKERLQKMPSMVESYRKEMRDFRKQRREKKVPY